MAVVSMLASMTSYILVDYVWKFSFGKRFGRKKETAATYGEQLNELTSNLIKASKEVDRVLNELTEVASGRENAVRTLESQLSSLEEKEKDLKNRIDTLEKLRIPVAEYFAKLVESGEKRSAQRDYLLFGAGVVVSTIIAIILKLVGWG